MLKWTEIAEHWLAIEVPSRSSRVYDRELKRAAYFALGVAEVWLVDWRERAVEVWTAAGTPRVVHEVIRWRPPTLDVEVAIDLAQLFAGIEQTA